MNKKLRLLGCLSVCFAAVLIVAARSARAARPGVETVPDVDLKRYAGKWFEIARLPNRFQRGCASDTTATYTLRPDGKVSVVNQCRTSEGKTKSASGTAHRASGAGTAGRLRVTFFWPFYGDYWILALDPEYRWALVGDPERKYLWVLARAPHLDERTFENILEVARRQGYDLTRLMRTPQGAVPASGS